MEISKNIEYNRRIGYCHLLSHKGFLTKESLKEHKCVEKNCVLLQKFDVPYWETRTAQDAKKKLRRYYARHKRNMLIPMDSFLNKAKDFYGSYSKVPIVEDRLSIEDLLKDLAEKQDYAI